MKMIKLILFFGFQFELTSASASNEKAEMSLTERFSSLEKTLLQRFEVLEDDMIEFLSIKEEVTKLEYDFLSVTQFEFVLKCSLQVFLIAYAFKLFFESTGPSENIEAIISTRHTNLLRENQNLRAEINKNKMEFKRLTEEIEKLESN